MRTDRDTTSSAAPERELEADDHPGQGLNLSVESPADLEARVHRLEDAVASLQDTHDLEERIVERVTGRIKEDGSLADKIMAVPRTPPPRYSDEPLPTRKPLASEADASRADADHRWLFIDMIASARLLVRMLFDRRFLMSWTTHLVVWVSLVAITFSNWWFPPAYIPVLGDYFVKALDLILAFCIYKALSRELRRYRAMLEARALL